jgi:hypothetical protein
MSPTRRIAARPTAMTRSSFVPEAPACLRRNLFKPKWRRDASRIVMASLSCVKLLQECRTVEWVVAGSFTIIPRRPKLSTSCHSKYQDSAADVK